MAIIKLRWIFINCILAVLIFASLERWLPVKSVLHPAYVCLLFIFLKLLITTLGRLKSSEYTILNRLIRGVKYYSMDLSLSIVASISWLFLEICYFRELWLIEDHSIVDRLLEISENNSLFSFLALVHGISFLFLIIWVFYIVSFRLLNSKNDDFRLRFMIPKGGGANSKGSNANYKDF